VTRKLAATKTTKPVSKSKIGRPAKYSPDLAKRICDLIAAGETDGTIGKMAGMPSAETIRCWKIEIEEFSGNYARAREARADFRSERMDEIARQLRVGKLKPDAARVLIDNEKWQAGKEQPKRYGDRIQVDGNMTVSMSDEQLESRIAQLLGKA
jgi:hypothetical protein